MSPGEASTRPRHNGGHEIVGKVAEFGNGVVGLKAGMRVAVNPMLARSAGYMEAVKVGGFGEYVRIENAAFGTNLFAVPESISDLYAATIEPAVPGFHRIIFFGTHKEPLPIHPLTIISRELTFRGSCGYRPEEWGPTIELVESGRLNPRDLVTHRIGFRPCVVRSRCPRGVGEAIKVIVDLK
jgi:threonine dehydrogenase-like Zn-dependent dehydrogenase